MRRSALRSILVAAVITAVPLATAFAAQSSSAVPNVPASSWKPERPIEFVQRAARTVVEADVAKLQRDADAAHSS